MSLRPALLLLAALSAPSAPITPAEEPVRVLFVGNSYTYFNNLPALVRAMAEARGQVLETEMVAPGGWRLEDHFEKGEARALLRDWPWDHVVLQEQSTLGTNLFVDGLARIAGDEVFHPWAEKWVEEITSAKAKPVFYLTWARKASPEDQATLTRSVLRVANPAHAAVAPAGPAFALVRAARPELELFIEDGSHPSPAGSYLAACTIYATVFGASPVGLPAKLSGPPVDLDTELVRDGEVAVLVDLGADDARVLQESAWRAIQELEKERAAPQPVPEAPAPPPLPRGEPLSEAALAGTWQGTLAFSPTGPADMTIELRAPAAKDGRWSASVRLEFHSRDAADATLELTDLAVEADQLSFSVPKLAFGLDAQLRAVLAGGELDGRAEALREDGDRTLRVLGSWRLRRMP
jgi:hypothetical protein